jgi:hypothetical protein
MQRNGKLLRSTYYYYCCCCWRRLRPWLHHHHNHHHNYNYNRWHDDDDDPLFLVLMMMMMMKTRQRGVPTMLKAPEAKKRSLSYRASLRACATASLLLLAHGDPLLLRVVVVTRGWCGRCLCAGDLLALHVRQLVEINALSRASPGGAGEARRGGFGAVAVVVVAAVMEGSTLCGREHLPWLL